MILELKKGKVIYPPRYLFYKAFCRRTDLIDYSVMYYLEGDIQIHDTSKNWKCMTPSVFNAGTVMY
jgi:hypothetical protein